MLNLPALKGAGAFEDPISVSDLGVGQLCAFETNSATYNEHMVEIIPDSAFQQVCETECCESAESCEAACGTQSKCRKFTICGSISVDEEVNFFERERSQEESDAESTKKSCSITNNASNCGCGAKPAVAGGAPVAVVVAH